ncbi:ferric reductase-like transmembrane domain-containing protein [Anabaena sp. FACHB-709]|uniref:Ferric reductase-like transmembrane component protein n=2 Tax=Nostocaceae TaxID=1162 RepID=A0A1Z4KRM8_ANAVA|nr:MULTISPECIES: ferric reductase-like transmembrane domain-containing protein [Nostocaceae]BAY71646.1 ferric reductase-like transmembrane component protein [Trichormus variabilis NIES-23]MBD2172496.1 ferric reductase-like transmembrane domain-containing protein [Anabaena cylindrica FACHB-318]MBD2264037.1 ferric reductase-like transmembrane domain-containing protein [Anabaena sp. FACHB-709]MBD2273435.1 ferric reductase-like transmembrane domain-containing protein [Nostoc sp. PCC 7120 = FACHB-41
MFTIDDPSLANVLGMMALVTYCITLLPTILRIVFPQTKETGIPKWLLKRRRMIGLISFFLALAHGFMMIQKRNFDFFDFKTFVIYIQGISIFTIFTILAVTSNDWSVKKLKSNWKQLHKLTYLAMFILTWHIWDKMSGHWTYLTPISIVIIAGITVLFMLRMWMEHQVKRKKFDAKINPERLPDNVTR